MKTNNRLRYLYHIIFCSAIILSDLLYFNPVSDLGFSLDLRVFPLTVSQILAFYINSYWLIPKFFKPRRYTTYGLSIGSTIILLAVLAGYQTNEIYPVDQMARLFDGMDAFLRHRLTVFIKRVTIDNSIMAILSFAYSYYFIWKKNEQEKVQLKEENLKSELSYLSAQLDPHFLFNTLNTLYSLALKGKKQDIHMGLNQLSSFIDQMSKDQGLYFTSVSDELKRIENYIHLQKLRFSKDDEIDVRLVNRLSQSDAQIASRVLIPLVENAFKHGLSLRNPSFIHIDLHQSESDFNFTISNTDHAKVNDEKGTGLGLENIRKRLELMYKEDFSLDISGNSETFKVSLTIKMKWK